jgi:AcrR family transcriptional regulator
VAAEPQQSARRRRRPDELTPARDEEVLRAAAEIFHRRGYARTSVQDIADAVGILKGSLYHYINSKEDLLYRILLRVHEESSAIFERVRAHEGSALERLRLYVREHATFNARNVIRITVYYHDFGSVSAERAAELDRRRKEWERQVGVLIDDAKKEGSIDASISTPIARASLLAQCNWLYTWYRPGGRVSPEELGRQIADIAIDGLAARD